MKTIIVINLPLTYACGLDFLEKFGYNLFYGNDNIQSQWKRLEELRETGGLIVVQPNAESAIRELLDPYIAKNGFLKEGGPKLVHTKEHGDFEIILFYFKDEHGLKLLYDAYKGKQIFCDMMKEEHENDK